jgi:hypothetical protein
MSAHVLPRIHQGIAQAIDAALAEWEARGNAADLAREVEDAVRECLDYPDKIRTVLLPRPGRNAHQPGAPQRVARTVTAP